MNRVILYAASIVAVLSSCSESADIISNENTNEATQTPVNMSVYTASSTRAGNTGNITDAQSLAKNGGFGVFAYQTGSTDYTAGQKQFQPDFMYNQQVTGTDVAAPVWSYSPIKYWPNDNDEADNAGAKGETNTGKVSFFAYAPYANLSATDANKNSGIIAVSKNSDPGDPTVTYQLTTDGSANVDLLWGTAGTNGTTVKGVAQSGAPLTNGKANVNVNLTKMKNSGKILFVFKHALAKFGGNDANTSSPNGILIKADPDITDPKDNTKLGNSTKITVKNITITTDGAGKDATSDDAKQDLVTSGSLNLATGVWTPSTTTTAATLKTVISNTEHTGDALLNADIAEPTTKPAAETSETTKSFFDGKGVQTSPLNVYASEANPFVFIPGTKIPSMKVTVEYVVRTKDPNVVNGYTTTTNKISKVISFGGTAGTTVEMNKRYSLTIILGLSGIKFDATVAGWDEGTTTTDGSGTSSSEVNLPVNVQ